MSPTLLNSGARCKVWGNHIPLRGKVRFGLVYTELYAKILVTYLWESCFLHIMLVRLTWSAMYLYAASNFDQRHQSIVIRYMFNYYAKKLKVDRFKINFILKCLEFGAGRI